MVTAEIIPNFQNVLLMRKLSPFQDKLWFFPLIPVSSTTQKFKNVTTPYYQSFRSLREDEQKKIWNF